MKGTFKEKILPILIYVLSFILFFYAYQSLSKLDDYGKKKSRVKVLETSLSFKKMEEKSLEDEINQGKEALSHLDQIESDWKNKKANPVHSGDLEAYLFDTSLSLYPLLGDEDMGGMRLSPFYEENTVDALSRSLALKQSLSRLKRMDLETSLAANSAIFRRMGSIRYFYESSQPGAWFALLRGYYKDSPNLEGVLNTMQGQMEASLDLKAYLRQILSLNSNVQGNDLNGMKDLWSKEKKSQALAGDYKQTFKDASYTASFLMDTSLYGIEDLKIKAKSLSTNDFGGLVRGYYSKDRIYYLSIQTEDDLLFAYFTGDGLLISVFNVATGEAYYLKDIKEGEGNRWAQIANLAYQLIKTEIQDEGQ